MIRVHFLINKLNIEHIIALGGKKSNEKLGKKGNRCKNAANSVTGHVCVNSNKIGCPRVAVRHLQFQTCPFARIY